MRRQLSLVFDGLSAAAQYRTARLARPSSVAIAGKKRHGKQDPYLPAQRDPYCVAKGRSGWTADLTPAELRQATGAIAVEIASRTQTGRVQQLRLLQRSLVVSGWGPLRLTSAVVNAAGAILEPGSPRDVVNLVHYNLASRRRLPNLRGLARRPAIPLFPACPPNAATAATQFGPDPITGLTVALHWLKK